MPLSCPQLLPAQYLATVVPVLCDIAKLQMGSNNVDNDVFRTVSNMISA